MRKLGTYPDDQAARFVDYLVANEMPAQISPASGGGYDLWIVEEDHLAQAKQEFAAFVAAPSATKYQQAASQADRIRDEQVQRVRQYQKNIHKISRRSQPRQPPVGMAILLICVVVFAASGFRFDYNSKTVQGLAFMSAPRSPELEALGQFELSSYNLSRGELWRMLTPSVLHMSFAHIIFNMSWLVGLGFNIERREGSAFFLWLVLLTAAVPNLLQGLAPAHWDGTPPGIAGERLLVPFGGFSGVAYGLFGFAWLRGTRRFVPEYLLSPVAVVLAIGWLMLGVLGLDAAILRINMANWGHGGGLVIGMIMGLLPVGRTGLRKS
jgi:GlpG protein